jgi:Predicted transcriptional regulator
MTIQELRKSTAMSQSKFSAYFGIPTATLQDWEHKRRTPPPYIIDMMKRILELEKKLSEKG